MFLFRLAPIFRLSEQAELTEIFIYFFVIVYVERDGLENKCTNLNFRLKKHYTSPSTQQVDHPVLINCLRKYLVDIQRAEHYKCHSYFSDFSGNPAATGVVVYINWGDYMEKLLPASEV